MTLHSLKLASKAPENRQGPKRKRSHSNHPFSRATRLQICPTIHFRKQIVFASTLQDQQPNDFHWHLHPSRFYIPPVGIWVDLVLQWTEEAILALEGFEVLESPQTLANDIFFKDPNRSNKKHSEVLSRCVVFFFGVFFP